MGFNFFCFFFSVSLSFWGAMFFAFHPSLCSWFGWIAGFQQVVNFTFIILIAILFKKYLDLKNLDSSKNGLFYYLSSIFIFLIALFNRETVIFFPVALFLWALVDKTFHKRDMTCAQESCSYISLILKSLLVVSGFIFANIFYFLFRLYFFPFKFDSSEPSILIRFFTNLSSRFFDLVTFLSDLAGLSFLPNGHQIVKGSLIIVIFSFLLFLFIKSREKKLILFLLVIAAILMWPAIFRYYSSRYLYKALPLFIFILMIFVRDLCQTRSCTKIMSLAWLLVLFNMVFLFVILKNNEKLYRKIHVAFDELCADARVKDRALGFVGIPYGFFPTGVAQAVWMRGVPIDQPIYYDRRTFGFSHLPVYENCIKIIPTVCDTKLIGFKIICSNLSKLTLSCVGQAQESNLGDFVSSNTPDKLAENYSENNFVFYKKYIDQNLLLITWDYENCKFIIL